MGKHQVLSYRMNSSYIESFVQLLEFISDFFMVEGVTQATLGGRLYFSRVDSWNKLTHCIT